MTTRAFQILAVATLLLGLAACGGSEVASPPSTLVGPAAYERVIAQPDRLVINVHVPFEGALPGTDLMIPFDKIEQQADRLPADRRAPLAIYCKSGRMSAEATQTFARLGYTDVIDLEGGMDAWQAEGRPLLTTPPQS